MKKVWVELVGGPKDGELRHVRGNQGVVMDGERKYLKAVRCTVKGYPAFVYEQVYGALCHRPETF